MANEQHARATFAPDGAELVALRTLVAGMYDAMLQEAQAAHHVALYHRLATFHDLRTSLRTGGAAGGA